MDSVHPFDFLNKNILETCSVMVTQHRQKHTSTTSVCYIGFVGKNKVCEHCSAYCDLYKNSALPIQALCM
jgi:hypothetical protein